mgnify:CR=1 FL=1
MMNITDIALGSDGDISVSGGDFEIVADKECFQQTLSTGLKMPPLSLPHAPWEGVLIPKETPTDGDGVSLVKRRYEDFLSAEERIKSDSVEVGIDVSSGSVVFLASFKTEDGESYEGLSL